MSSSPLFISGEADFYPPPYSFTDATCITFPVEPDDPQKLEDVCDQFLNEPLGRTSTTRFELSLNRVLVTFSRFPRVESTLNPAIGYLSYQEVSLIIMVRDNKNSQVGMYSPALFLDGPQPGTEEYFATWPTALGREVFGLPKARGEIKFYDNYTGELKSLFPSGVGQPLDLSLVVTVGLVLEANRTAVVLDLVDVENAMIQRPCDLHLQVRKQELLGALSVANRERRAIRSSPMRGRKYHPFELVNKLWGSGIADRPLRMRDEVKEVPKDIRDALILAKEARINATELAPAVRIGLSIGFFGALGMTIMSGPGDMYYAGAGYPLLGLRQLHTPGDFLTADHRDVIRSPLEYLTPSENGPDAYVVRFHRPDMINTLGLKSQYVVQSSDTILHLDADASYGEPSKTGRVP